MADDSPKPRWGAEQRLEFIDFICFWEGEINRSDITQRFGVSAPQASTDLTAYQQAAPGNLHYDLSAKRYVTTAEFTPRFIRPNADRYLAQLTGIATEVISLEDTWLSRPPEMSVIPMPRRKVDPLILRAVLRAIRLRRSIEIEYQSLNTATPGPVWRWITPHAFASDGFRWHIRAFCHRDAAFKDFLLSRCCGTRAEGEPSTSAESDREWSTHFDVQLKANPNLSEDQRKAVELDYDMRDGVLILRVRLALLYYFDKRLRADFAKSDSNPTVKPDPREIPLVVDNREAYETCVKSMNKNTRNASTTVKSVPA
jgi:predicted DNA-binding transcriptional regulator YafY